MALFPETLSKDQSRLHRLESASRRNPADAKASISASVTNGGIDTSGLAIETTQSSRRRLEGRLNGGGAPIQIEGTNGGIRIGPR